MKTTVFDLIWKLKRELEKNGYEKIDLHRFTHELAYRREILLQVDVTEFELSSALQNIYGDLLIQSDLDLAKEVEIPEAKSKPVPLINQPAPSKANNRPIYFGFAAALSLMFVFAIFLFGGFSESTDKDVFVNIKHDTTHNASNSAGHDKQPGNINTLTPLTNPSPLTAVSAKPSEIVATAVVTKAGAVTAAKSVEPSAAQTLFRIYGSNTIGETLAPELIKAFYKEQGIDSIELSATDIAVENNLRIMKGRQAYKIPIHAHGSSTGFKALMKGNTDLAMASRRIKDKEVELLKSRYGYLRSKSTEHIIGMDGLAVIINPANPLDSLNTDQLAQLFAGKISNWKQLGGEDLAVKIFARDANSGTWDSFKSMVLKKHGVKLSPLATRIESSIELSDSVSKERGAIGFIGLPYVLRAKAVAVSDGTGQPIYPTSFTISTEDYPLVRRLYIYEPSTINTASDAHRFISFALSKAGQEVVKKVGFISQNIRNTKPILSKGLPDNYLDVARGAERLSLNFRFHSGTFILDNKAERDLERVVNFFENNPGQQAVLIGFSDSIGEPAANTALSLQRAKAVETALLARGINVSNTLGFGEIAPIASNRTATGRERNRRVEIWVSSDEKVSTADRY